MKYAVIALLLLAGCATANKMNSLHVGMTKQQVISQMGAPTTAAAENGTEILYYDLYASDNDAMSAITTRHYTAFKGGKLVAYGPAPISQSPLIQNNINVAK